MLSYSKILVTGGAGFIGSHLVDRLLDEGFEVSVIDNFSTGKKENIEVHQVNKGFHFVKADISNLESIKNLLSNVDAVFHQAALVSVIRSVESPILANEINVQGTLNLLKVCLESPAKRFIFASSCAVYGPSQNLPLGEETPLNPISPYAATKIAAEKYVQVFHKVYGLDTVCLRYFNVYGPRQAHGPYSGVISTFLKRLLSDQPPVIHGDGEQTRDFINVQDVVEANILALKRKSAVGKVFNIATGKATTINHLAKSLQEATGKNGLKPIYSDPRPGDIKHSYADISKARKILGFNPKIGLQEGLNSFVRWHLSQKS